jgi:hypothetical protein
LNGGNAIDVEFPSPRAVAIKFSNNNSSLFETGVTRVPVENKAFVGSMSLLNFNSRRYLLFMNDFALLQSLEDTPEDT